MPSEQNEQPSARSRIKLFSNLPTISVAAQSAAHDLALKKPLSWCSILELVRTHFGPKNSERLRREI